MRDNYRGIDSDGREWVARQQAAREAKGGNMNADHVYPLQSVASLIVGLILINPRLLNHISTIFTSHHNRHYRAVSLRHIDSSFEAAGYGRINRRTEEGSK
jgi:hypothetical protein